MSCPEDVIRAAECDLVETEDRRASVLALMTKISDPDLLRDWAVCAESLRRQVASKKRHLRDVRRHGAKEMA